jgi:type VI secretion system protein ImpF
MAELTPKERLQPSLLDRLTDDEPDQQQESRDQRVLSANRLRECVLRDLGWLFNSTRLPEREEIERYPFAAHSVINFGLPPLTGATAFSVDMEALERNLRQVPLLILSRAFSAIAAGAHRTLEERMSHNALTFEIEGDCGRSRLPLQLYLKTEIDLESGQVQN